MNRSHDLALSIAVNSKVAILDINLVSLALA